MGGTDGQNIHRDVMLADLSRGRQDELPLSNNERKGPSYAPNKNNGVAHIGRQKMENIALNWKNAEFTDYEAEQMKGLAPEDARPWAKKKAMNLLEDRNFNNTRPPVTKPTNQNKRPKHTHALPQMVPLQLSDYREVASKWAKGPAANKGALQSPAALKPSVSASTPPATAQGIKRPAGCHPKQHKTVMKGECKMTIANADQPRKVQYKMRLVSKTNGGLLRFRTPGLSDRFHDVLEMESPGRIENTCILKSQIDGFRYRMQFETEAEAERFSVTLKFVQKAAWQCSPQNGPAPAAPAFKETSVVTTSTPSAVAPPIPAISIDTQAVPAKKCDLIDAFTDDVSTKLDVITTHLAALVEKMVRRFTEEELGHPEAIKGIEDAALAHWAEEGFFSDYNDEFRASVVELMQSMIHVKVNLGKCLPKKRSAPLGEASIDLRESFTVENTPSGLVAEPSPIVNTTTVKDKATADAIATKDPEGSMEAPDKRIQYSVEQLEKLYIKVTPPAKEIEVASFLPKPMSTTAKACEAPKKTIGSKQMIQKTVKKRLPEISKHTNWLQAKSGPDDHLPTADTEDFTAKHKALMHPQSGSKMSGSEHAVTTAIMPVISPTISPPGTSFVVADLATVVSPTATLSAVAATVSSQESKPRPHKGLADSVWAKSEEPASFCAPNMATPVKETPPAEIPASRSIKKSPKGLSSSRYATKPVPFEGNFTGTF